MLAKLFERFGYVHKSKLARNNGPPRQRAFGFHAADSGRLFADWPTTNVSADTLLRTQLVKLRPRAREFAINNRYFKKFLAMVENNVVGVNGMTLKNKAVLTKRIVSGKMAAPLDTQSNDLIEEAWYEWSKPQNCTVSKEMSWREVQAQVFRTVCTDGEVLIRKIRGAQADNPFGFALQVLECDVLDIEYNHDLANGNTIRLGVEKTPLGKRVAYWIFKSNPSDFYYPSSFDFRHERIPANEIKHIFLPFRPQQTRGFPWAAASMVQLQMLDGFEESELVRNRDKSQNSGWLKKTGEVNYEGPVEGGSIIMESEPGQYRDLPAGLEVQQTPTDYPSGTFDPYVKNCLRGISSGLLVSYPNLANDYASVNFSAGRMAQLEERDMWGVLQGFQKDHVCSPIFSDWLEMNLSGPFLPGMPFGKFELYNRPDWHGRGWVWVDPMNEAQSTILALNSGLTSLTRELALLGLDRDELLAEIKSDNEAIEAAGLTLPEIWKAVAEMAAAKQQPPQKAA